MQKYLELNSESYYILFFLKNHHIFVYRTKHIIPTYGESHPQNTTVSKHQMSKANTGCFDLCHSH